VPTLATQPFFTDVFVPDSSTPAGTEWGFTATSVDMRPGFDQRTAAEFPAAGA